MHLIKDVLGAGGPGLLIPVVLFGLVLYAARGLFGLHGRRNQSRNEFLERWDPKRIDDDLWLEVTIRHLYGTNLPAHVIRAALAHPHASQALSDLSDIWAFLSYDADTQTVSWQYSIHRNQTTRGLLRYWPLIRYFLFAFSGASAAYYAAHISGLTQWVVSIFAAVMISCAFISLWHGEAEKAAAKVGEAWIKTINGVREITSPADATDK